MANALSSLSASELLSSDTQCAKYRSSMHGQTNHMDSSHPLGALGTRFKNK